MFKELKVVVEHTFHVAGQQRVSHNLKAGGAHGFGASHTRDQTRETISSRGATGSWSSRVMICLKDHSSTCLKNMNLVFEHFVSIWIIFSKVRCWLCVSLYVGPRQNILYSATQALRIPVSPKRNSMAVGLMLQMWWFHLPAASAATQMITA